MPTAHVWLTCAPRRGSLAWPLVAGAAVVALLPLAAALAHVSGSLELGSAAPWLLLLMVSDGQFGFGTVFSLCLVIGGLLGVVAVSLRGRTPPGRPQAQAVPGDWAQGPVGQTTAGDARQPTEPLGRETVTRLQEQIATRT